MRVATVAARAIGSAFIASILCVLSSSTARAQSAGGSDGEKVSKKVCIAAAERGQELRDGNQFRDARGQFSLCARSGCPARISTECKRWLAEAEAATASVRIEPVDGNDNLLPNVRVFVDGKPWTDEPTKEPLVLDPGSHEIRLEYAGAPPVTRAVTLAMGERGRVLRVPLAAPRNAGTEPSVATPTTTGPPREADDSGGGSLAAPIALGAMGVVALGAAGTFWLLGNGELEDVRARCTGGCASSEADGARTKHLVGDIALGVGIVSLGVATVLLVVRSPQRSPAMANLSVAPTIGGAVGSVEGRF